MASDGLGGPEDHRDDGTHFTEAGVPVDSNSGKVTLKATEGKLPCVALHILILFVFLKWVYRGY